MRWVASKPKWRCMSPSICDGATTVFWAKSQERVYKERVANLAVVSNPCMQTTCSSLLGHSIIVLSYSSLSAYLAADFRMSTRSPCLYISVGKLGPHMTFAIIPIALPSGNFRPTSSMSFAASRAFKPYNTVKGFFFMDNRLHLVRPWLPGVPSSSSSDISARSLQNNE